MTDSEASIHFSQERKTMAVVTSDSNNNDDNQLLLINRIFEESFVLQPGLFTEKGLENNFYLEKVVVTKEEAINICILTTKQQNDLWRQARKCRITGSVCYELYTYTRNKNPDWNGKVQKVFFSNFSGNADTKHGVQNEGEAKRKYEEDYGTSVTEIGLVIREEIPWLGYSPDGIVNDVLIEVKCPVAGKKMTAAEVVLQMKCFKTDENNVLEFKTNHKFYAQIQLGMFLLNLKKCHFIVYATFDKSSMDFEIDYDETYILGLIASLKNAYFSYMLPVISEKYN